MGWMPLLGPGGQAGTRRKHRSGFLLATRTKACLLRRRRGGSSPPYLRRNQRLMIPSGPVWPPGPGSPWPLRPNFLQRAKMLRIWHFSLLNFLGVLRALCGKNLLLFLGQGHLQASADDLLLGFFYGVHYVLGNLVCQFAVVFQLKGPVGK